MNTFLNVHDVEQVQVLRMDHTNVKTLTITVTSNEGDEIEIVLFSHKDIELKEVVL